MSDQRGRKSNADKRVGKTYGFRCSTWRLIGKGDPIGSRPTNHSCAEVTAVVMHPVTAVDSERRRIFTPARSAFREDWTPKKHPIDQNCPLDLSTDGAVLLWQTDVCQKMLGDSKKCLVAWHIPTVIETAFHDRFHCPNATRVAVVVVLKKESWKRRRYIDYMYL